MSHYMFRYAKSLIRDVGWRIEQLEWRGLLGGDQKTRNISTNFEDTCFKTSVQECYSMPLPSTVQNCGKVDPEMEVVFLRWPMFGQFLPERKKNQRTFDFFTFWRNFGKTKLSWLWNRVPNLLSYYMREGLEQSSTDLKVMFVACDSRASVHELQCLMWLGFS